MTQRDGMGREMGGGFWNGDTCTPEADSYRCMAKTITILSSNYPPIKINKLIKKKKRESLKRGSDSIVSLHEMQPQGLDPPGCGCLVTKSCPTL